MELHLDAGPSKRFKGSIAEASRPNCAAEERIRDKKGQKENRGRKRKTVPKDAVYTNWMTPLL
jgi:hypothetical protein